MISIDRFDGVGIPDIQDLNECLVCGETVYAEGDHYCQDCMELEEVNNDD